MFETIRSWLELAYFGSTIIVAIAALLALKQISLLKKDIYLRNKRASMEKAIEYVQKYGHFAQLAQRFFEELRREDLPTFSGQVLDFSPASVPEDWRETAKARRKILAWIPAINELDAVATAFVAGVACDETGFKAIGRSYCANVGHFYDLVCLYRTDDAHPHFESIVSLYRLWSQRLTAAELKSARRVIDEKIAHIPQGEIHSIGVNQDDA